jgi:NAD(P)-dependent dehydrogenase (short-subunit alcohol dehydrogenase family)
VVGLQYPIFRAHTMVHRKDRSIVVTGAGRGIGAAVAWACMALGARELVMMTGIRRGI